MQYAAGCYTSLGGPGLIVFEIRDHIFKVLDVWKDLADPIWIEKDKKGEYLYAAVSDPATGEGMVASFRWYGGKLDPLSRQYTGGRDTCHLALDEEKGILYAANYQDGSLAVFPVKQGIIEEKIQWIRHQEPLGPDPSRQEHCHIHQISFRPCSREVFVCDLGADLVMVYEKTENGTLVFSYRISAPAGTGPRHLLFDGPDRFYLVGELGGWLSEYECINGLWSLREIVSTLPKGYTGKNTAAAIRKAGDRLFVSNRGHDSIAAFEKKDGGLKAAGWRMTKGKLPRDFLISEEGFLTAQQGGGGLSLMGEEGQELSALDEPGMVCVCCLE